MGRRVSSVGHTLRAARGDDSHSKPFGLESPADTREQGLHDRRLAMSDAFPALSNGVCFFPLNNLSGRLTCTNFSTLHTTNQASCSRALFMGTGACGRLCALPMSICCPWCSPETLYHKIGAGGDDDWEETMALSDELPELPEDLAEDLALTFDEGVLENIDAEIDELERGSGGRSKGGRSSGEDEEEDRRRNAALARALEERKRTRLLKKKVDVEDAPGPALGQYDIDSLLDAEETDDDSGWDDGIADTSIMRPNGTL